MERSAAHAVPKVKKAQQRTSAAQAPTRRVLENREDPEDLRDFRPLHLPLAGRASCCCSTPLFCIVFVTCCDVSSHFTFWISTCTKQHSSCNPAAPQLKHPTNLPLRSTAEAMQQCTQDCGHLRHFHTTSQQHVQAPRTMKARQGNASWGGEHLVCYHPHKALEPRHQAKGIAWKSLVELEWPIAFTTCAAKSAKWPTTLARLAYGPLRM